MFGSGSVCLVHLISAGQADQKLARLRAEIHSVQTGLQCFFLSVYWSFHAGIYGDAFISCLHLYYTFKFPAGSFYDP